MEDVAVADIVTNENLLIGFHLFESLDHPEVLLVDPQDLGLPLAQVAARDSLQSDTCPITHRDQLTTFGSLALLTVLVDLSSTRMPN
jgi:hypothetical protein